MSEKLAWSFSRDLGHEGVLVPESEVRIPIDAHALHYGSSVFEGIRRYDNVVFRLHDHLVRLHNSANMYGMKSPFPVTVHQLMQICLDVAAANPDDTYLRPIIYRGSGLGVNPRPSPISIAVISRPWGKYLKEGLHNGGASVLLTLWRRCFTDQLPVFAKGSANYVQGQLAKLAALDAGYSEGLIFAPDGEHLSEASGMNLFIVNRHGDLVTPDCKSSSCLAGLTRDTVIEIVRRRFSDTTKVIEGPLTPGDLRDAREAFFTGTATEVTPITRFNGQEIGVGATRGQPGEFTLALSELYQAVVSGRVMIEPNWLSWILEPSPESALSPASAQ